MGDVYGRVSAPCWRFAMRLVGLAVAGLLLGAVPASAQYIPRPVVPIGPPSAYDVAEIVQAMGLDPIGAPMRSGPFFVQRAVDDLRPRPACHGRCAPLAGDRRRGDRPRAVRAVTRATGPTGAPIRAMRRFLPTTTTSISRRPGSIMGARMPPHAVTPSAPPRAATPKPATKSANAAPVPRKRPAAAPQEAAGSVEPLPGARRTGSRRACDSRR